MRVFEALATLRGAQSQSLPSLIALLCPILEFDGDDMQQLMDRFAAVLPPFLARHTQLRHLSIRLMASSANAGYFQSSIQPLQQLQSLELLGGLFAPTLELHAPLSCPHLLEVTLESLDVPDESLSVLLSASPQLALLRIRSCDLESWNAVQIAARHCPQLRHLAVSGFVAENHNRGGPAHAQPGHPHPYHNPPVAFLPRLELLSLCQRAGDDGAVMAGSFSFVDLHPLVQPSNHSLRSVELIGADLTSADINSLSVLPSLSYLALQDEETRVTLPEVQTAVQQIRSYQPSTLQRQAAFERAESRLRSVLVRSACSERIAALDVWDAEAVARRVTQRGFEEHSLYNLLCVDGLDPSTARPLLFQALQAEIARSPHGGTRAGRLQTMDMDQPWRAESDVEDEYFDDEDDQQYWDEEDAIVHM